MTGIHFDDASGPEDMHIYAIGDVHGRRDLLDVMFERINAALARQRPADWRIVLLGDYIDRGPDSKGVLDVLCARKRSDPHLVLLAGNHDAGFMEFLERPKRESLFAGHGGGETAKSYGVPADFSSDALAAQTRERLLQAIPPEHLALMASLERSAAYGDFYFCHAGIRPGVPLAEQDSEDLIWIRGEFLRSTALHPKVIVHGHTPGDEPEVRANRVNLDTRAYETGRLTALAIGGQAKRFLTVEGAGFSGWR